MKDNENKARLLAAGIAVLLIIIICGISFVVYAVNKKAKENTGDRLQTDIIEYANSTQEQNVQAKDIPKEETEQDLSKEEEGKEETETGKEEGKKENVSQAAVIVDEKKNVPDETIIEEETNKTADNKQNRQTTAKWQKEASENLAAVEIDLPRQMAEMKGYWEAGNMEAVEDLAYLPRYRAASEKLSGTTKYYYYGDTDADNRPEGKGLAMYNDNQYYYGEWKNGVRSGSGMWIKYYFYDRNAKAKDSIYLLHSYSGMWGNDLPNGDGAEHYDFIDENLEANVGYNRNFIGGFKNGLYDGNIYITDYYNNGNTKEWNGTAKNGVWQTMGEKDKKGQYPVIVEVTNPDNYQWMPEKENVNNGVDGLISAAKS